MLDRVIDANLNRAREGLRVCEEIVRFVLNDPDLTSDFKNLRSDLKKINCQLDLAIYSRDIGKDVGRKSFSKEEKKRQDYLQIFSANIKRVQEALRVLEEFLKVAQPALARQAKKLRFELYALEKRSMEKLQALDLRASKLNFSLYGFLDFSLVSDKNYMQVLVQMAKGGLKILQYRDKFSTREKILQRAKKIARFCQKHRIALIINDHVDIAKEVEADGVHLGQGDISSATARKILGIGKIIGRSTHSFQQALAAEKQGADYIACGPIFKTPTKKGRPAVGLDLLKKVAAQIKIPVVAIGDINLNNLAQIKSVYLKAKVAVLRGLLQAKDIAAEVKYYQKHLAG